MRGTQQQELCFDPPTGGRHPATSFRAAERVKPHVETLREKVFDFIKERGVKGATDDEIQLFLRMHGNTERPRRRELEKEDSIVASGEKRRTGSGCAAKVWVVTDIERESEDDEEHRRTRFGYNDWHDDIGNGETDQCRLPEF